jgi:hypothetical protein
LSEAQTPTPEFLYVYCVVDGVVDEKFGKIGVGGRGDEVYGCPYKDLSAIVSRTDRRAFERNEEDVLAHQRVIQKIFNRFAAVPMPFSTVLENETELQNFLESRYNEFRDKIEKLREIVQPTRPSPGRQLVEEALAQSFASALRIRQLSDEVSKLAAAPTVKPDRSDVEELASEVRGLREELKVLRAIGKVPVASVEKVAVRPEVPRDRVGMKELAEDVASLRAELERIKTTQSEASSVSESAEKLVRELMERAEGPGKPKARGPPYA